MTLRAINADHGKAPMLIEKTLAAGRDLRFALKSLRRSPGFSFIAVVTLALGIGANTSMFSVLNGYMLRPTPYPDRARLERIFRGTARDSRGGVSAADYLDLKAAAEGYGEIAAYATTEMSISEQGRPAEMAVGARTSTNLFDLLGAKPRLGRTFRPDEDVLGRHRELVLSDRYWHKRFGGDPAILGRTVRVDGEPYTVVGVLPEGFSDWRHLSWVDAFRPLALDEKERADRSATWLRLVGRRSPAVSPIQAAGFIDAFGRRLAKDHPAVDADTAWRTVAIDDSFLASSAKAIMAMLVGLSAFVLLIACSNLANLLLARTIARAREFALRAALGASRARVLRPLLAESLLLAFAGGVGALFVAKWTFAWMAVASRDDNGVGVDFVMDWHVLGWGFAACLFTALAFGVAPALFASRLDLNSTLKSGSRGATGGRRHRRFRNLLIVAQFALAMVLLAGAALFVRGLDELNGRREGWRSDQLVTASMVLTPSAYPHDSDIAGLQQRALDRIEGLPGVASASLSWAMPFFGVDELRKYLVAGRDVPEPGHEPAAVVNGVSPHYFETVGTRLIGGRAFDRRDELDAPKVYVVNEAMARGLFGGESAIGKRIAPAGGKTVEWGEIVGVVANVRSIDPSPPRTSYQLYVPMAQEPRRSNELAVRAAGVPPFALVDRIRTAMMGIDADLPLRKLQPAENTIARVNYQLGVLRSILSAMGLLGLGLAILGIYGVIARTTAQRTGEFGIRMAVGAQTKDILRLVLTSGAKLAVMGSAIGLVGAFGVGRLLAAAFPAIHTDSVAVLVGVTLLLVAIAQVACYLPARHAAKVSPSQTLWSE
ncbi:MAG TPA: ABC transporter permease [Thermoanaerobaculia bacterium]|jgi:predicted permease|nr:ABC transporter permease [Thermoanaerobaculia bacterium]